MIFRGIFATIVIAALTSAATIPTPNTTRTSTFERLLPSLDPADVIVNGRPFPSTKDDIPALAPFISCNCNLPECLAAAGGDGTCSTQLGCFIEVQPITAVEEEDFAKKSNNSMTSPDVFPNIATESDLIPVTAPTEHTAAIKGLFGCLDLLSVTKQSCYQILRSMEAEVSEFPVIKATGYSGDHEAVLAIHCCQTQKCNANISGQTEASVKSSAQAVLVSSLRRSTATFDAAAVVTIPTTDKSSLQVTTEPPESLNELWHPFMPLGEPGSPMAYTSPDAKAVVNFASPAKSSASTAAAAATTTPDADTATPDAATATPAAATATPAAATATVQADNIVSTDNTDPATTADHAAHDLPAIQVVKPNVTLPVAAPSTQDSDYTTGHVDHGITKRHYGKHGM